MVISGVERGRFGFRPDVAGLIVDVGAEQEGFVGGPTRDGGNRGEGDTNEDNPVNLNKRGVDECRRTPS